MSKMYNFMRRMMGIAETVGDVTDIDMGVWLEKYDRISLRGTTPEGQKFEMTLEINKEVEQDA